MANFNKQFTAELIEHLKTCTHKGLYYNPASRNEKTNFNMNDYVFDCNTPSCIAGHAVFLHRSTPLHSRIGIINAATDLFGLGEISASVLFNPYFHIEDFNIDTNSITPQMAIDCLQHMIDDPNPATAWLYAQDKHLKGTK